MSYIEELSERVMLELTEILLYCHTCQYQVLELLKVANCIFDKQEFFDVVDSYANFRSNMEILENLLEQIDEPISMLQIITVKSMVNELKDNFDELIAILDTADKRIDNDNIDFSAASMLNDLLEKIEFDVAEFEGFEECLGSRFFVTYLLDAKDEGYDHRYHDLKVLMIESFKAKREAYSYALKNGISKDMVWCMYE